MVSLKTKEDYEKSSEFTETNVCVCVHICTDSGSCASGGFSNTLGWMAAFGNRQKLDCLPLLTLGEMFQEKMVHQSEVLWALGSKAERNEAEETVPAAISTAA